MKRNDSEQIIYIHPSGSFAGGVQNRFDSSSASKFVFLGGGNCINLLRDIICHHLANTIPGNSVCRYMPNST
jgi:hypothetical protein